MTQVVLGQLLHGVDGIASASQDDPLHVSPLCSAKSHDASVSEHFQTDRVNSLFVDDHETLVVALADLVLQVYYLLAAFVGESAFAFGHFVAVGGVAEEELRVDFCFFVLKGDVAGEDVTVLQASGHIRVTGTVVEHEPPDQLGVAGQSVHHVHDLYHVEVDRLVVNADDVYGLDHDVYQLVSQVGMQLSAQSSPGYTRQQRLLDLLSGRLEGLQELQGLLAGKLVAFGDDARVYLFLDEALSLFHQVSDEEDIGGSAVSHDVVLGSR